MSAAGPDVNNSPTTVDHLFGLTLIGTSDGHSRATGRVPLSPTHSGWLGPIADLTCATAFTSTLPDRRTCATVSLRVDRLGPALATGETVTATGRLRDVRGDLAFTECEVRNADGQLVATALARFAAAGTPAGHAGFESRAALGGEVELAEAVALRRETSTRQGARYEIPEPGDFANPLGVLHGGVQMALAEIAVRDWLRVELNRDNLETLDCTLRYLRPVPASTTSLVIDLRAVRVGRRVAVVAGELLDRHLGEAGTTFELTLGL